MIDKDAIAKMKDGVRILNFARGGLVNSADVVAAIEAGKVAAYVTDFPPTICWASTASSRSPIWRLYSRI